MKRAKSIQILAAMALCTAGTSAWALGDFTETFSADHANWRYPNGAANLEWSANGGPTGIGDGYVSATGVSFNGKSDGQFFVVIRGNEAYGSSGGAFAGNWRTSGVYQFSIDVRHDVAVPTRIGVRLAKGNHPAVAISPADLVPPGVWTRINIPVSPSAAGYLDYNFEGSNFSNVFSLINSIQPMFYTPAGYGSDTNTYTLDIDNPTLYMSGVAPLSASTNEPTYDRWMYVFGPTTGANTAASTFRTEDARFDERDAQAYFSFVLTNEIPAGLGAGTYEILSCRFTATVIGGNPTDPIYDSTLDAWTSCISSNNPLYTADEDEGRPMELYGAAWRYGFTPWTFGQNGPFYTGTVNYVNPDTKGLRTVYPLAFRDGQPVDVSNNVDPDGTGTNGFTALPFAIGTAALTPGDSIPSGTEFTFDLDTGDAAIQSYLGQSLNEGILPLVIATLHLAQQPGDDSGLELDSYPQWAQRENIADPYPATLEITYKIKPDLDLGFEEGVRVARWSLGATNAILESTSNLVGAVTWQPMVTIGTATGAQHEVTLPNGGDRWFFRLRQP